jgi:hypothetical protein
MAVPRKALARNWVAVSPKRAAFIEGKEDVSFFKFCFSSLKVWINAPLMQAF